MKNYLDYEKTFYSKNKYGYTKDVVTINANDKTIKIDHCGTAKGVKLPQSKINEIILFLQIADFTLINTNEGVK